MAVMVMVLGSDHCNDYGEKKDLLVKKIHIYKYVIDKLTSMIKKDFDAIHTLVNIIIFYIMHLNV